MRFLAWLTTPLERIVRNCYYTHHLWVVFRSGDERAILGGLLITRIRASLLGRLFVRREASLERDLTVLLTILRTDGIALERYSLWVTRRFLSFKRFGAFMVIHPNYRSILVAHNVAALSFPERLWVLGHELGHELDQRYRHTGHPVFSLFQDDDEPEAVAEGFGWYLLERIATFDEQNPKAFDFDAFAQKLPGLMADRWDYIGSAPDSAQAKDATDGTK